MNDFNYVLHPDKIRYSAIWNGNRYLGCFDLINDKLYFIASTIRQPMYSYELAEIARKLDELNGK